MQEGGYTAFMETITKIIMIETITFNKYFHISYTSFQL
nr:MAG TPA: hypothetical protein [Caudoviricetes sp.]